MPKPLYGIHILSLKQANALLPQVRSYLQRLRELKGRILTLQAKVDIEELTATPAVQLLDGHLDPIFKELKLELQSFRNCFQELYALGCELKDLDQGLVDFYGLRGDEIVYYCWKEGEENISHWHALEAGFRGRQSIEEGC